MADSKIRRKMREIGYTDPEIDSVEEVAQVRPADPLGGKGPAVNETAATMVCARCGRMQPCENDLRPFGWERLYTGSYPFEWDLCPSCTVAYLDWLDQPERERRETSARIGVWLHQLEEQIELAKKGQPEPESDPEPEVLARRQTWLDRLLGGFR
jgi:hypothetical protein